MDFSYVHIRYFIGDVYHICLQDTIQSTLSLCLRCQAMLLPMPLRPLLLTTRSGFTGMCGWTTIHVDEIFVAGTDSSLVLVSEALHETFPTGYEKKEEYVYCGVQLRCMRDAD